MKQLLILTFLLFMSYTYSQDNLGYQKPDNAILDLVDVPLAPSVLMDSKRENMILLSRNAYKTIEELSQEELRLAGLRIDPKTNISSRANYINGAKIKRLNRKDNEVKDILGLPKNPRLTNFTWSPDQSKIAMTNTTSAGVELWVLDLETASAKKLSSANINANMRDVINWFSDNKSMLVKMVASDKKALIDVDEAIPSGPTISISEGKKAQNRTYQDLLKNKNDEHNFEQLAKSEIYKVSIDGTSEKWLPAAMYSSISFSPNGEYIMVTQVQRPFSYLVPYRRFPSVSTIYDKNGKNIQVVSKVPLLEDLPKGFMSTQKGKRSFRWRADKPSSLTYAVALDDGDPAKEVEFRDEVFNLDAPFAGDGTSLLKTKNRYSYIDWATDNMAIAHDYWWNTRNTKSYLFNPSDNKAEVKTITDRNYQDRYSDPGEFVTKKNQYGKNIIATKGDNAFLLGDGFTKDGQFPFVDKFNLKTLKTERAYTSTYTDRIENINSYDVKKNKLLVRIESQNDYPNYYFRNLDNDKLTQITNFDNPFKILQDVHKEVITYKREDGLELSGTLYLPVGYDKNKKEKMPMILWAYPREYKDKSSASQKTSNENKFIYPYWGSPIYWVNKGYVVLDNAAFPIVGEGDEQPNDSFRKQLVSNGKAAIDAVDQLGYIDRNKVAVGGHSYGAFMVANLLSHSDLFAAGIARSGAYNRTLTPFGFQSEERSYWEAPDVYNTMSPFMHADKMKTPLLLVHGQADNNSGTYPLQSERYFNALKGLGATVRLVMLPKESHGYRAKESILHLLWEQDQWLEKHVKNRAEIKP